MHGAQTVLKTVASRKADGSIPLSPARKVGREVMQRFAKPSSERARRFESCTFRQRVPDSRAERAEVLAC